MLVSQSASSLAKDGLVSIKRLKALNDKVAKVMGKFKLQSQIAASKNKEFSAAVKMIVPVKTRKEVNQVLKMLKTDFADSTSGLKLSGDANKWLVAFSATDSATAKKAIAAVEAMPNLTPNPVGYYVMGRKAKVEEANASKFNNKDVGHLAKRAVKLALRKKLSDSVVPVLAIYEKGVLPATLEKEIKAAEADIKKHISKAEKVKELVTKIRAKNRDERSAAYDSVVGEVKTLLAAAGIKESSIALGKTLMGGQTLFVRLPSKQVITVGLGDIAAFNKARKSATDTEAE